MMKISKTNLTKVFRVVGKVLYWLVLSCLAIIALAVAISAMNLSSGFKLYTVQSGSMSPSIPVGSIVASKPVDVYQEGDVITFVSEEYRGVKNPKDTTTHRVVGVEEKDGQIVYTTKGDANDTADTNPVTKNLIFGKTIASVPYLGYLVSYAKTREGLIILVIIPATLIIYSELMSIKNEVGKLIHESKRKKSNLQKKTKARKNRKKTKKRKND